MVNLFYLDKDPKKCAKYYCDKHVNKIMIEIAQILSQAHHLIGTKTPPYQKCRVVKKGLAPYEWSIKSTGNYNYCAELAYQLLLEYKFRYQKDKHKCEEPIKWLKSNLPEKVPKGRRTKFKLTKNTEIYHKYFNVEDACKLSYVDFKCKTDKWTRRNKPKWFKVYEKKSKLIKKKALKKINKLIYKKLPEFSLKHKLEPRRFHSFLRISYDELFQKKWNKAIKTLPKMFTDKKPLINQLGCAHLLKLLDILNSMLDLKTFNKLNKQSLVYRKILK